MNTARCVTLMAAGVTLIAAPLSAQEKPPAKPPAAAMDHSKMDHAKMDHAKMDHGAAKAEGWKELDAYHQLMMATWHPAKDKNDLAPIRAKAAEMVASAKLVAASTSPMACQKPELLKAQAALPMETEKVAAMVAAKAADTDLKAGLKGLHDRFDVLEGCASGMKH
ncbi:MAG: hypothetical protein P3B76_11440 [Gemmatimonadota bacterium]|nr:hypothetical protein [Gemmatimonadota bacterium]MDQ8167909.1 hypothetical protein [Gemmatimonadota bacterium]MDQ8173286.1 hypothetical protein [Gemmatimonadota bacterium]